jgi:parvulin-like peptidyl-prolyl isomerase
MAQQYQQLAAQSVNEIPDVWGSTDVDSGTLNRMIDDQVYLQSLDEQGITITDDEVELFMLNQFADPTIPLLTPTPTPTFTPDRAAMATATAQALAATPQATPGTPVASPIAEAGAASPVASPMASPMASPATDEALGTPSPEQARAIAESNFTMFERALFETGHLTREDYLRLVAEPALARTKIDGAITAEVGQSAEQVHAAHILVETQDLAQELASQLADGADFAELAAANSIDEGTAPNGGDLGWFTRDEMVAPFAEAAFALEPGETSEPVQSEFGWHIIRSVEHDPERALTDQQIARLGQTRVASWLEERRAELEISSSSPPTPTPLPEEFVAPVEAPPLPTLPPEPDPVASPQPAASPALPTVGSPVAAP